jgi:hypothetical protein
MQDMVTPSIRLWVIAELHLISRSSSKVLGGSFQNVIIHVANNRKGNHAGNRKVCLAMCGPIPANLSCTFVSKRTLAELRLLWLTAEMNGRRSAVLIIVSRSCRNDN